MRPVVLVPLALLAACAGHSTPPSATPATTQTIHVTGASSLSDAVNSSTKVIPTFDVHFDTLPVSLDRIWKALPDVYTGLEIPIGTYDAEKNLFGNGGMKVYRRLGKTPLTKLLDCGRTQIGPSADSYEIVMSILTRLTKVDSMSTLVATSVEASGRPLQYAGGDTRCRTKGELERAIILGLEARLLK